MPISIFLTDDKSLVPVKVWSPTLEDTARAQLLNVARLPFVFSHVAAMPDVHWGMGATVGSVIATKGAIMPAAVGVDIGCGMVAVQTNIGADLVRDKTKLVRQVIENEIPVGFAGNSALADTVLAHSHWSRVPALVSAELLQKAKAQLGSLGSGNHFIEVCTDQNNMIWLMLHSGSRNVGKVLADMHIHKAKDLMKRMFINLPDPDLAYFVQGTPEFTDYIEDLLWCQEYAAANRNEMMLRLKKIMRALFGEYRTDLAVNCHHNYVAQEHHFGHDVWITRKGAVRARRSDFGIIPGSMGTGSYIVEGKGNAQSFDSCAHGAGRKMGRKEAKRRFSVADLEAQTAGVECRKDADVLDEIPGAYKDIDEVMENQSDLMTIRAHLKQIVCVKG